VKEVAFQQTVLGAQLLQIQTAGHVPWVYCSPMSPQPSQAVRGGVSVLFPQFASHGPLPKHGFARNMLWQQQKACITTADYNAIYTLDVAADAV
jgi:glucose-6-phosphate 1-epimerase